MEGLSVRELFCVAALLLVGGGPLCAAPAPFMKPERVRGRTAYDAVVHELTSHGVSVSRVSRFGHGSWRVDMIEAAPAAGGRTHWVVVAADPAGALGVILDHYRVRVGWPERPW
jgi:hypothetical protein